MAATYTEAERAKAIMAIQSVFDRYVTHFLAFYRHSLSDIFQFVYGSYSILSVGGGKRNVCNNFFVF